MKIGEFFRELFGTRLSFGDIWIVLKELLGEAGETGGASLIIERFISHLEGGGELVPTLLFILSLFVCMFGGRMFSLFRILAFLVSGYLVGACFLARGSASAFAIGLATAILFALFSRPLYFVVYPSVFALACYVLVGNTLGWGIAPAIVAAVCALLLALVMQGSAEIVITAIFGAWGICESVAFIGNIAADCQNPRLVTLFLILAIAFVGALVQFKTRQRAF